MPCCVSRHSPSRVGPVCPNAGTKTPKPSAAQANSATQKVTLHFCGDRTVIGCGMSDGGVSMDHTVARGGALFVRKGSALFNRPDGLHPRPCLVSIRGAHP